MPWHKFTKDVFQGGFCRLLEIFIPCDRQAGSCLSPCGCSSSASCCCRGKPRSKKNSLPGFFVAPLQNFGHKAHSMFSLQFPFWTADWTEVKWQSALFRWVTTPQDRADADKAPRASWLFPQNFFSQKIKSQPLFFWKMFLKN